MSNFEGVIAGAGLWERCVRLAGCLAELGTQRLLLRASGLEKWLEARGTDLPGEVARAAEGLGWGERVEVDAPAIGARFWFSRDDAGWMCGDGHVAQQLRSRLHS